MRHLQTLSVFVSLSASFTILGCCREGSVPSALAEEASPTDLLSLVPSELKFTPRQENLQAQERWIEATRIADRATAHRPTPVQPLHLPCSLEDLQRLREVVRSGEVEVGFDPEDEVRMNGMVPRTTPGTILAEAGLSFIVAGRKKEGFGDLKLAMEWNRQTFHPSLGFPANTAEFVAPISRALQLPGLTVEEKRSLLMLLPSKEEILQVRGEEIRMQLHAALLELAQMKAPRQGLLIPERPSPARIGRGAVFLSPRLGIAVPPHGTLDRQETAKSLILLAKELMEGSSKDDGRGSAEAHSLRQRLIKWLPTCPLLAVSGVTAERKSLEQRSQRYADEMNQGHNTLGREFIRRSLPLTGSSVMELWSEIAKVHGLAPVGILKERERSKQVSSSKEQEVRRK